MEESLFSLRVLGGFSLGGFEDWGRLSVAASTNGGTILPVGRVRMACQRSPGIQVQGRGAGRGLAVRDQSRKEAEVVRDSLRGSEKRFQRIPS